MLNFTYPTKEDIPLLTEVCENILRGTELYCALVSSAPYDDGSVMCGKDENGQIKSLIYNNGDGFIRVFGDEVPPFVTTTENHIMIYSKRSVTAEEIPTAEGKRLLDVYRLFCRREKLSFDDERRYSTRMRYIRRQLSATFCIHEGEKAVSCAAIGAMNKKYALICDVFTKESHRGSGLAKKVLNAAISHALKNGRIPYLICNEGMCSYYEKSGFTHYGML